MYVKFLLLLYQHTNFEFASLIKLFIQLTNSLGFLAKDSAYYINKKIGKFLPMIYFDKQKLGTAHQGIGILVNRHVK